MPALKILLIAASIGAGHVRAAAAVGAALRRRAPSCTVRELDILSFFPQWLVSFGRSCYFGSLSICPQLYARSYAWGNAGAGALVSRDLLGVFLARRLRRLMAAFAPDAVICTHAAAAAAVSVWLKMERRSVYHAGVVTDFVVHRFWRQAGIDDYFLADPALGAALPETAASRLHGFGIPVAAAFAVGGAPRQLCAAEKTILLMGGGDGLLPMLPLLAALENAPLDLRLICLAGRNERLRRALASAAAQSRRKTTVLGFTDAVPALMRAADVMISKPGGVSASEALCAGLPLLLYHPLPGQERGNADFLTAAGAARALARAGDAAAEIDKIFRLDPVAGRAMLRRARQLAKPDAADRIAEYILNKLCI